MDERIELSQKCKSDYGENSTEINKGNKIYAVGYGYNTFGEYASLNAVRSPIIRWNDAVAASPDIYGQTFIDWFAFQACELGLEVGSVVEYDSSVP